MTLTGKGTAIGAAIGKIHIFNEKYRIPEETLISEEEVQSHLDKYSLIKKEALSELEQIKNSMVRIDPDKAAIFEAHQEIVEDLIINEDIPVKIKDEHWAGDWAIYQVYEAIILVLRQTDDPLLYERAVDFDDVRALLLGLWYGKKNEGLSSLKEPVIIAAYELKPRDTASLDKNKVLAILTETGGLTSHTAIISKSYGIPAVLGIEGLLSIVKQGQLAAVNTGDGTVILSPSDYIRNEFIKKTNDFRLDMEASESFRYKECFTSCGQRIDIGVNIAQMEFSDSQTEGDLVKTADGVGLFRTEFLFLGRNSLPQEEEQFDVYRKVLESFNKKPVILRTLDIGADKQLPCMEIKREENPFLGNRGIRFCFKTLEIFKTQLRAALRAGVYGNLWLMFPMIGSIDDIHKVKELIKDVKFDLENEGIPIGEVKIGIMIEVPSIALIANLAVKEVDFASIGSNDLCQYLCAADRMNADVDSYYQSYHPAMWKLLKEVVMAFNNAGKPISICGELASDIYAVPALLGLGLRKLSMGAAVIAPVKRKIASITIEKAKQTADKILSLNSAEDIEEYLKSI
ncbi:MAG: phosphoenolpyruvate--protein phosphotransferase [Treponema sp.]|nr:phosphoenolpyruvate--protein phosphotransferase [Treponema sp.]